jgi:uncharacterized membrane protein
MIPTIIVLVLVTVLIVLPVWTIIRVSSLGDRQRELMRRMTEVELELARARARAAGAPPPAPPVQPPLPPAPAAAPVVVAAVRAEPPPLVPAPVAALEPPAGPVIDWEQFMGAKLFAWLGGLALFLGVAFFVKYSFEHDLIPPEVRVTIGFVFGAALIVGGLRIPRERYAITALTLIAAGVVSLYAVTFACHAVYHFAPFGLGPTFLLMALITAAAFTLAVRLDARVVAVLGLLGGFLTPIVLSTGEDNPAGIFGYLALLDLGLVAVALHRRWAWLVPLGAAGTVFMQAAWAQKFFEAEKAPVAVIVCLGFCALFLGAYETARRLGRAAREITAAAAAMPFVAFGFALFFLGYDDLAARPGLVFGFVFLADACLLALAWLDGELPRIHLAAGIATFALLAWWTGGRLTDALLPWALLFYLLHAALHTAFPLALERRRPAAAPAWWSQFFPPLTLLLMLGPLLRLDTISLAFWPCVLLVDLIAIGLALLSASLLVVGVVLVLTLVATGVWISQMPAAAESVASLLVVTGGFAAVFFAAGVWLPRRLGDRVAAPAGQNFLTVFGDARAQLPAFSALLPFLLLTMMAARLPLADPTPVFGLALLLTGLVLGLTWALTVEWLPACALAGVAVLESTWRSRHFAGADPAVALMWYLGFAAVFAAYPFVFRRRFTALTGPWAVAALAGAVQFSLVHRLVKATWPLEYPGLLPALFALPPLLSLAAIRRSPATDERVRLNQLAWFGGAALLFVTLIFPIQFERQWITLGWALEGAALLWLFHHVPHPGLRAVGVVLLTVAFARLAFHPVVLSARAHTGPPLLNWHLYAYGVVTACLFAGAWLLAPPRERVFGRDARPLLNTLGVVLAFLLLNVALADCFSVPGRRVRTFEFSGDFARDMTCTIAWALFALGLLLAGVWKNARAGRYAAVALLSVALLKLFLHDLAHLGALHRIGALFAVAVIALVASLVYQRFVPGRKSPPST